METELISKLKYFKLNLRTVRTVVHFHSAQRRITGMDSGERRAAEIGEGKVERYGWVIRRRALNPAGNLVNVVGADSFDIGCCLEADVATGTRIMDFRSIRRLGCDSGILCGLAAVEEHKVCSSCDRSAQDLEERSERYDSQDLHTCPRNGFPAVLSSEHTPWTA